MMQIERYSPDKEEEWNIFVSKSRSGTFLLDRRYMDYHADRFSDFSLMIYDDHGHLAAMLPANRDRDTVISHQGLTYGGLLTMPNAGAEKICDIFTAINRFLHEDGVRKVIYKATPWIYHTIPAEEDLYALTKVCGAHLGSREISSTIILDNRPKWSEERRRGVKRAMKNGITTGRSENYAAFWEILTENLHQKYGVAPVHALAEIELLHGRFPENIRLYTAVKDGNVVAGTVIYNTGQTTHVQYISASPEGKRCGALDMLFGYIMDNECQGSRYFDFGKSTEEKGMYLNRALIHQKEGFGARGVCYDCYEWEV